MSDLKPCPFCGSDCEVRIVMGHRFYAVHCTEWGCCTIGPAAMSRETAVEKWNARPVEDAQAKEIERLQSALEIADGDRETWIKMFAAASLRATKLAEALQRNYDWARSLPDVVYPAGLESDIEAALKGDPMSEQEMADRGLIDDGEG